MNKTYAKITLMNKTYEKITLKFTRLNYFKQRNIKCDVIHQAPYFIDDSRYSSDVLEGNSWLSKHEWRHNLLG